MKTQQIRKMIQHAVDDEKRTGRLAEALRTMARQNGKNPTKKETQGVVDFVREYVEHVPYYLEQGTAAAQHAGLGAEMTQMVTQLESYWFDSDDAIPDHLGLFGLMDDAYASLILLQGMSDYVQASAGRPLLERNLTEMNQLIRQLIGQPVASHLEARVGVTISQAMMQRLLTQVAAGGAFAFGGGPDPIWGNASVDEIVNARLGAMGVV